jgi:hypothetical protein
MIAKNLAEFKNNIPENVKLVAVSKTKSIEQINEAFDSGHRHLGENKVQELVSKHEVLSKEIHWHFIGHLQRNKVKYIAPFVHLIHGVDSIKLLTEINKQGQKNNRVIDILLQFHIAQEDTKFGLNLDEAIAIIISDDYKNCKNVRIAGIMGMASYTVDKEQVRKEFKHLKQVFDTLKESHFADDTAFCKISMGMSGDYQIAIEEGSTMIRVGSSIFGARE